MNLDSIRDISHAIRSNLGLVRYVLSSQTFLSNVSGADTSSVIRSTTICDPRLGCGDTLVRPIHMGSNNGPTESLKFNLIIMPEAIGRYGKTPHIYWNKGNDFKSIEPYQLHFKAPICILPIIKPILTKKHFSDSTHYPYHESVQIKLRFQ